MNLTEFQEFRKILCVCPCCGDILRVSDLRLFSRAKPVNTWLDEYEKKDRLIDKQVERFEDMEEELRAAAIERGRKAASKVFKAAISPAFNALKYDPFDILPIFNPVDFVVFKGMNSKDKVSDVVFLSKAVRNPLLNNLRKQVNKAVEKREYEWKVARIDEKGRIEFE